MEREPPGVSRDKLGLRTVAEELAHFPKRHPLYDEEREIRHCLIQGTPYHVFFRVSDENGDVDVVAAWSAVQGEGPPL